VSAPGYGSHTCACGAPLDAGSEGCSRCQAAHRAAKDASPVNAAPLRLDWKLGGDFDDQLFATTVEPEGT